MKDKCILQIIESIAKGLNNEEIQHLVRQSQSRLETEIAFLLENRDKLAEILNILFPKGIPVSSEFYNKLSDVQYYLEFKSIAMTLVGFLWIEAYKLLPAPDAQALLQLLIEDKNIDIWSHINSLPILLSEVELPSDFASNWFFSVGEKIKSDLAGGDSYRAVENYSFNFPKSGLDVLEKYLSEGLDVLKLHLSAIILGSLRASSEKGLIQKQLIEELDNKLVNNPRTELRICYHRSWVISFRKGILSIEQLEHQLSKMMQGTQEEIDEAFNVLHGCLLSQLANETFINFSMRWLNKNTTNKIPPLAKYCVVNSMRRLSNISGAKKRLIDINDANKLVIAIQPVSQENAGTWSDIEHFLVDRLREDKKLFADILNKFVEVNLAGLLEQFESDKFSYLKSEMNKSDVSGLLSELLFSMDERKRKLGIRLFQDIKNVSLPTEILEKIDESQLGIALCEFIRRPFLGNDTSRFFIMLEPRFRSVPPELQEEFKHEMVMQAINYPGGCLKNWEKINNPSELLKGVIESAKKYFENLKNICNSPANNFSFPECNHAVEKKHREFSRKVSKETQEKSILMKLVKKVDILYGKRWSAAVQGNLGDPTSFKEYTHSMEFPCLEEIDPEGMAIRRFQATIKIKHIQKKNASV